MDSCRVTPTNLRFSPAPDNRASGLLGYVEFDYCDLHVDGVTVRRSASGTLVLAFPERVDSRGHRHPVLRPLNDTARLFLEEQILTALGLTGD